jgi:hypothetical protein
MLRRVFAACVLAAALASTPGCPQEKDEVNTGQDPCVPTRVCERMPGTATTP